MKKEEILLNYIALDSKIELCTCNNDDFFVTYGQKDTCFSVTNKQKIFFLIKNLDKSPIIAKLNNKMYISFIYTKIHTIIFGPFKLKNELDTYYSINNVICNDFDNISFIPIYDILKKISFLYEYFNETTFDYTTFYSNNFKKTQTEIRLQKEFTDMLFNYNEDLSGHHSSTPIRRLEECVKNGDLNLIPYSINEILSLKSGITSKDALRNAKNLSIVGITNITKAAINGGLFYEIAYTLSDTYIMQIESAPNIDILNGIFYQACFDFTRLVKEHLDNISNKKSETNYYSDNAKKYIFDHLHETIEVKEIAKYLNITPNYLSNVFKKSEKITITDYIFNEKIQQAKRLLVYSNVNSSEIAFHLGFSSQSHFCQVFKKYAGKTPKQFLIEHKTEK